MGRLRSLFGRDRDDARSLANARFVMSFVGEMVVPLFVLDLEGKVIVWNQACEKLTGLAASEVIGTRNHWKGLYPAARPTLADLVLKGAGAEAGALYAAYDKGKSADGKMKAQNWCGPAARRALLSRLRRRSHSRRGRRNHRGRRNAAESDRRQGSGGGHRSAARHPGA